MRDEAFTSRRRGRDRRVERQREYEVVVEVRTFQALVDRGNEHPGSDGANSGRRPDAELPAVTRDEKIALLHELVEHSVAHRGLRADLHELIHELPHEQGLVLIVDEAS